MEPTLSWSHGETEALIAVWSDMKIRRQFVEAISGEDIYREMSDRLAEAGVSRSARQCQAKISSLVHQYRRRKLPPRGAVAAAGSALTWPDSVKDEGAASSGEDNAGQDMTLELLVSDVEPDPANVSVSEASDSRGSPQAPFLYSIKVEDSVVPSTSAMANPTSAPWDPYIMARKRDNLITSPTCSWSQKEVLTLLTLWGNPVVQHELSRNVRNNAVYRSLSAQLASLGYNKSAQKCKEKLKKLKQDYKKVKNSNFADGVKTVWFDLMDQVLGSQPEAIQYSGIPQHLDHSMSSMFDVNEEDLSPDMSVVESCSPPAAAPCYSVIPKEQDFYMVKLGDHSLPSTSTVRLSSAAQTPDMYETGQVERRKYAHTCSWSKKEVQTLLAYWSNPAVQQELRCNVRNNTVYSSISAKLASMGFNKSAQKCKEKIKKLKQDYRRIKKTPHSNWGRTDWFGILDEVLGSPAASRQGSLSPEPSSAETSQQVATDVEADEEAEWSPDEVQVLITLWAQPNIQKQLQASGNHHNVFGYLSSELALVGFNKTPKQCSDKVDKLKEVYKNIKHLEPHGLDKSDWFAIIDGVLGSKQTGKAAAPPAAKSLQESFKAVWTAEEVQALLRRWAARSLQQELRSPQDEERLCAQLSSELASQGFHKTSSQCRTKLRLLKQDYKRLKGPNQPEAERGPWFSIMEDVFSCWQAEDESEAARSIEDSNPPTPQDAQAHPPEPKDGCRLSLASLGLLVPTLRLMCAFAWQVVKCSNIRHYRKVEELVVLATELDQELLTPRERVQLLLRLRARLVLELCRSDETLQEVEPHLKVIQDLKMCSGCSQQEAAELENSKLSFMETVHTLLEDQEERNKFFTNVFPAHYGQQFEATLSGLVWKFIFRLDSLLPVPDIKQTAAWLGSAPSIMEECGKLVLEPKQVKELLHLQSASTSSCPPRAQDLFLPALPLQSKANAQDTARSQTGSKASKESDAKPLPLLRHSCSMCPFSDSKASALLQHIREVHLTNESGAYDDILDHDFLWNLGAAGGSGGLPHRCDSCSKTFLYESSLTAHRRVHVGQTAWHKRCRCHAVQTGRRRRTGERPHTCKRCGRSFSLKRLLVAHMRRHGGADSHRCPMCPLAFPTAALRRKHLEVHLDGSAFRCVKCGRTFRQEDTFKLHVQTDSCERTISCHSKNCL